MKTVLYNPKAGKKATNVSINSDLLKQAKALSARYTVRSFRYTCHPRGCPTGR
ncbi:type II toxin-antitoxin system CcdA family antitoxin [Desulfosarcina variabilis]|uniref:type II toxin-antitoxin system CcdA family antitoxin n=1 Tax=Desulfosarcina variabilis TaxID=2300 RepID=UPI003AFAD3F4